MRQHRLRSDHGASTVQRLMQIAQQQAFVRRDAVRVCRNLTLEDEDRPAGQQRAQMIIGPAIAKTEFQHRTGQIADQLRRGVQAITLGGDTPDETVQPAHEALSSKITLLKKLLFSIRSSNYGL